MINRSPSASGRFAIICQSLYLANLLLLPGVFFLVLVYYLRQLNQQKNSTQNSSENSTQSIQSPQGENKVKLKNLGIGKIHLIRSVQLSILAGVLLAIVPLAVIYLSEQQQVSIMVGLIYFVTLHAGFVLIGMFNLSRAMAKKLPVF